MKDIIINNFNNQKEIMLLENNVLVEKYNIEKEQEKIEGNIYIGIVKDIIKGMQIAFIDIGQDKNGLIHIDDILPKVNICNNEKKEDIQIEDIIKKDDKILVQVKKDATNIKGAKLSTHIKLNSRYIALMPDTTIVTVSKKIEEEEERERLKNIAKEVLPENCGVIIRTSAKNQSKEAIQKDIQKEIVTWNKIKAIESKINKNKKIATYIYKAPTIEKKIIIDVIDNGLNSIKVNTMDEHQIINHILYELGENSVQLELINKENILENMPILSGQIDKIEKNKVWLKCGGFIVIDKTEALTVIDVNSGKCIGNSSSIDITDKVNEEATKEIAKQIRLRDIGGIIIIDYINMDKTRKENIIKILEEEFKNDRAKTQIMGFTNLDLLEITRKHISRD